MMDITLKNYVQMIYKIPDHEDRILIAAKGFIENFPFLQVHMYSYSMLSGTIEGILDINEQGTSFLDIRDNIKNKPHARSALRKQQAVYVYGSEFILQTQTKYTKMEMYSSYIIVVPIASNSTVIGFACPGMYNSTDPIGDRLLQFLTLYGKLVGNALVSLNYVENEKKLTKREIEVLQRASWGESVKEIADYMQISKYTIEDYMKSTIRKLNVQNRVQAVAEAIRQGIIK